MSIATAVTAASAQDVSVETLKSVTRELSSDAFEGRAPGTPAEEKTVAYLIARMKTAGLQPGNHGSWTQTVPLVKLGFNAMTPMQVTGGTQDVSLMPMRDMVVGTYRVVPRIALQNSELVFAGFGITAPEQGWDDYAGIDVRGKTVIVLVNDPDWQSKSLDGPFGGRSMTYYGRYSYKYEEAARHGAAGLLIVHDTEPAAYGWSVVPTVMTGLMLDRGSAPGPFKSDVVGWVQKAAVERVFAAAGQDFTTLSAAAGRKGFKAVPLGLKVSISFNNSIARWTSRNVIGLQPGRSAANEYIIYNAHWDHFGRCPAVKGDDICNGALDNASGVAALIALAEANAKAGPTRRSQLFMAVTGEEYGLLGSQYYAEHPVAPLAQTVGGVNIDILNVYGATRDFAVAGAGKSELEDLIKPMVAAQGRVIVGEPQPEKGFYYRSDHFNLAKLGVPMLYAKGGADLVKGETAAGQAAAADYVERYYHKPQDDYHDDWDWAGAAQDLSVYYQLGRLLADGTNWPNWYPTAEFRHVRDKSRASVR